MPVTADTLISGGAFVIASVALSINAREHRAYMRQQRARARFDVTLREMNFPDGNVRTDASLVYVRCEIGVKNRGDRAAGPTAINVLIPDGYLGFKWCGPTGEDIADAAQPAPAFDEKLRDADGNEHPARFLSLEVPRISRRSGHVRFFTFQCHVPQEGETSIPIRAKAQADELPDDVEEYTAELMVRVGHAG